MRALLTLQTASSSCWALVTNTILPQLVHQIHDTLDTVSAVRTSGTNVEAGSVPHSAAGAVKRVLGKRLSLWSEPVFRRLVVPLWGVHAVLSSASATVGDDRTDVVGVASLLGISRSHSLPASRPRECELVVAGSSHVHVKLPPPAIKAAALLSQRLRQVMSEISGSVPLAASVPGPTGFPVGAIGVTAAVPATVSKLMEAVCSGVMALTNTATLEQTAECKH